MADRFNLTAGHMHHTDMTLDQVLSQRPAPGWGRLPDPGAGPVPGRIRLPSGGRGDRPAGTQRGHGGAEGPGTALGFEPDGRLGSDQARQTARRPIQLPHKQPASPIGFAIPKITRIARAVRDPPFFLPVEDLGGVHKTQAF